MVWGKIRKKNEEMIFDEMSHLVARNKCISANF